jgi:hypothetical protein
MISLRLNHGTGAHYHDTLLAVFQALGSRAKLPNQCHESKLSMALPSSTWAFSRLKLLCANHKLLVEKNHNVHSLF